MARTLLLQPPLLLHADFIDYPYFASLGLWQAAAGLRQGGHDVQVLDALCQPGSGLLRVSNGFVRLGIPLSGFLAKLPAERPDVVVIGHCPWLRARPETHLRRVESQGDHRPMRGRRDALSELRGLLSAREPLYALADLTLDTDRLDLLETIWALEAWANEPA